MKSAYLRLFKAQIGDKNIQIRKNSKEYILMYCKTTVKDFNQSIEL